MTDNISNNDYKKNIDDSLLLDAAIKLCKVLDKGVEASLPNEIAEIIKLHSKGAVISTLLIEWLPRNLSFIAFLITIIFVWSMYFRINATIKLKFFNNIFKTIVCGVFTNFTTGYASIFLLQIILSFLPRLNKVGISVIFGLVYYLNLLVAGYIYLKIMTGLLSKEGKENFQRLAQENERNDQQQF